MPFHVAGEQAHEQVRAHPALLAMANGANSHLKPLQAPEPSTSASPRCAPRAASPGAEVLVQTCFGLDPPAFSMRLAIAAHLPPQHPRPFVRTSAASARVSSPVSVAARRSSAAAGCSTPPSARPEVLAHDLGQVPLVPCNASCDCNERVRISDLRQDTRARRDPGSAVAEPTANPPGALHRLLAVATPHGPSSTTRREHRLALGRWRLARRCSIRPGQQPPIASQERQQPPDTERASRSEAEPHRPRVHARASPASRARPPPRRGALGWGPGDSPKSSQHKYTIGNKNHSFRVIFSIYIMTYPRDGRSSRRTPMRVRRSPDEKLSCSVQGVSSAGGGGGQVVSAAAPAARGPSGGDG